jgi:hypothetical protein
MATIKTKTGDYKKILIEVQKSKDEDDVMRFRNYLAEQYKKVDKVNGVDIVLPITTIYILGFNLDEIDCPCVKNYRNYLDMLTKKKIKARSPFIEKLTHDSYVIQTKRITNKRYNTKLEKLLTLFEQKHFIDPKSKISKQYSSPVVDDDIQLITAVLQEMVANENERAEIEKEEEAMRVLDVYVANKNKEQKLIIEQQTKVIEEKNKVLEEQARQIAELKRLLFSQG